MTCQNTGCTNEVPATSKKYCSKRCKHQVACRESRRRLRDLKGDRKQAEKKAGREAVAAVVRRHGTDGLKRHKARPYKRHVKTIDASKPRKDGLCRMFPNCKKKAVHGRGLYCSDECRVRGARAKYNARQLASA